MSKPTEQPVDACSVTASADALDRVEAQDGAPSWAFGLLPTLSRAYWLCEHARLFDLASFRRTYAGFYFWYKRYVEDPFHGLVKERPDLFLGGHVIDVGAHIGYTTSLFLPVLSPGFRIFAIEPDRSNARVLRETVKRLRASDRIVAVEGAAGNSDGAAELWHNPAHPGDHRVATAAFRSRRGPVPTRTVTLRRVDSILAEHGADEAPVAFVKIDAQGSEVAICEGLEEALRRSPRAAVAVEFAPSEISEHGADPSALLGFFSTRGYRVHVLAKDGRFSPLTTDLLVRALERRGYADLLCLPPGID